jgi:hypothetical protein
MMLDLLSLEFAASLSMIVGLGLVTINLTRSVSGFIAAGETEALTDNEGILCQPTLLPAQPSVLTTRTSATVGTLTMTNTNHGIITGQRIDLYWAGGQCSNVLVGTVAGTSVPFTTATNLPIATTAINVGIPVQVACVVTVNNVSAIVLVALQSGYFVFDAGTTDDFSAYVPAGQMYVWKIGDVAANPLATFAITSVWISQSNTAVGSSGQQASLLTH